MNFHSFILLSFIPVFVFRDFSSLPERKDHWFFAFHVDNVEYSSGAASGNQLSIIYCCINPGIGTDRAPNL